MEIPDRIKEGLDRYVQQKCPTGDVLKAVLENNLMEAVGRADPESMSALREICSYLRFDIPSTCHGSPEKVKAWLASR